MHACIEREVEKCTPKIGSGVTQCVNETNEGCCAMCVCGTYMEDDDDVVDGP